MSVRLSWRSTGNNMREQVAQTPVGPARVWAVEVEDWTGARQTMWGYEAAGVTGQRGSLTDARRFARGVVIDAIALASA